MSLLHPNEDDEADAQGHTESGFRMALNRNWRLTALLQAVLVHQPQPIIGELRRRITYELGKTHYDETDDGQWRLTEPHLPLPPQKVHPR